MQWQGTIDFAKGILLNGNPHGIERETTLPVWASTDEGRVVYTEDTEKLWMGSSTEWLELTPGGIASHDHDDLYYTETELSTDTAAEVHYDNITNMPSFIEATDVTFESLETNLDIGTGNDQVARGSHDHAADVITYSNTTSGMTAVNVQAAIDELEASVEINSTAVSLDSAYEEGSIITVDTGDVDFQLTDTKSFLVADLNGAVDILKVTADVGGDSVTVVGGLSQSAGAVSLNAASASNITVTNANLTLSTVTAGNIELVSIGALNLKDSIQTSAIPFSQTSADGFAAEFLYTDVTDFDWSVRDIGTDAVDSIMGAINANRQDLYEYVELVRTQGTPSSTAAGASLVGIDGNAAIIPTGGVLGDDGNLQAFLEGFVDATIANVINSYADELAFKTAKAASEYLPADSVSLIQDTNRLVTVILENGQIVEGTDWDYLWDVSNPMTGEAFVVNVGVTTGSVIKLSSTGNIDIDAATGITIDENSGGHIGITTDGQIDIDAASSQIVEIISDTEIDLTATTIDINGDADVSGTFTMGSLVIPTIVADPVDTPAAGTTRFRTDTTTLWIYSGSAWTSIALS